uniref:Alternative protein TSR1 n=1 Tax=Homo sapiens TaxID=9606 RepID=L8EAY9_HUMAN|nr:alternative protein TSR1 [Homo sapiens]
MVAAKVVGKEMNMNMMIWNMRILWRRNLRMRVVKKRKNMKL